MHFACPDQRIRLEVTSIHSAGASAAARPNASEVANGHHPIHTNLRRDWAHHGWAHPLPHLHRDGKVERLCGLTSAPRASAFLRPWLHQQRLDSIQVPTSILLSRHRSHSHACTPRERSARRWNSSLCACTERRACCMLRAACFASHAVGLPPVGLSHGRESRRRRCSCPAAARRSHKAPAASAY